MGRVQYVLFKAAGQACELLLNLLETLLAGGMELCTAQAKVTQRVLDYLCLRRLQLCKLGARDNLLVDPIAPFILGDLRQVLADAGKPFVVRLAQGLAISHRIEVGDRGPQAVQPLADILERLHEILPRVAVMTY